MSDSQQDSQNDLLESLLGDFLDESDQLLTQLNNNLLQLDEWVRPLDEDHCEACDAGLLNEMFRAAHSIKGLSGMMGLTDINTLTHKIENVFDAARNNQLTINTDVVDLVFMGVDQLTALVELLKDPEAEPVDCDAVLEGIRQLLRSAGAERKQSSQADAERVLSGTSSETSPEIPDPFENLNDEKDISEKYVSIFIDETETALDELSETLLALEGGGDPRGLNKLLVTSHRIKGSAASVGLNRAAKLSHLMEDLLQGVKEAGGALSTEAADALLACTDELRQFVRQLREGISGSDHFCEVARKLLASHPPTPEAKSVSPQSPALPAPADMSLVGRLDSVVAEIRQRTEATEVESLSAETGIAAGTIQRVCTGENVELAALNLLAAHFDRPDQPDDADDAGIVSNSLGDTAGAKQDQPAGRTTFGGEVRFKPDLSMAGLKAVLICEKLTRLGNVCYCHPPQDKLEDLDRLDSFCFRLVSDQPQERIAEQLRVTGVQAATVKPLAGDPADSSPDAGPGNSASEEAAANTPAARQAGELSSDAESAATHPSLQAVAATPNQVNRAEPAKKAAAERPSREARQRAAESTARPTETVRVDIERLDELMDLAGQLVINKAQFSQIGEKLKVALNGKQSTQALNRVFRELDKMSGAGGLRVDEKHSQAQMQRLHAQAWRIQHELEPVRNEVEAVSQARNSVKDLLETIHQFDRVSNGIQQAVMDTRMVPIGPLFTRFNRVVRDIAHENGKDIRLEIRGEKTELDKRMIDELSDPLIHMIRNSADHGIEPPEVREAAGKPRRGTVTLEAFHRGNSIVIRVSDDGKGLDTERIVRKCVEKGIFTEADAEKMTPPQIHQMIWAPGMSTAAKVTGVSGRGMGMDIVKSKIEGLNGSVDIESAPGRGTTMTIRLPVTLAILPSLMVEIGGDVFAVPMEAVTEIAGVGKNHLSMVHGRRMATVRGRVISLVKLGDTLSFHRSGRTCEAFQSQEITLVIVGETGQEVGLVVDRVIGEEDVVIKSIAENYRNVPGIAGASILGDGRVSLILDISALIEMAARKTAAVTC